MGRPAPKFWWDFADGATAVVVQSDWPGGEALDRLEISERKGDGERQIKEAERLIADYEAGRKVPKWSR